MRKGADVSDGSFEVYFEGEPTYSVQLKGNPVPDDHMSDQRELGGEQRGKRMLLAHSKKHPYFSKAEQKSPKLEGQRK